VRAATLGVALNDDHGGDSRSLDTTIPGAAASVEAQDPNTLAGAFASALRVADVVAARAAAQIRGRLFDGPVTPMIPRYRLVKLLGRGGMGEVWAGHDERLDREVAVKLVHATLAFDDVHVERLAREARSLARLAHPNVVGVFDLGRYPAPENRSGLFIVMELVEGQTLSSWLATPRPWREIVDAFVQAGRGLAAAHGAGLVHRDFKPANVFVGNDGRVRVGDFGLARLAELPSEPDVASAGSRDASSLSTLGVELTDVGVVMGTPVFMSPEQHRGQPVDARSDQFGFCVALYAALWGELPFRGNLFELEAAKAEGELEFPRRTGVPARLEAIVARGLAPSPAARWPTMNALVDALARTEPRRRRPWIAAGALLVVAAAVAVSDAPQACGEALRASVQRAQDRADAIDRALISVLDPTAVAQRTAELATSQRTLYVALDEACAADPERATARWDCLSTAAHRLDAVTAGIVDADADAEAVATLFARLPDATDCRDRDAPSTVPDALRPQLEQAGAALEHAIARAAYRPAEALPLIHELVDELAALPPTGLRVAALHELGAAYDRLIEWDRAKQHYEQCHLVAVEIDDFDHAARCAFQLAWKGENEGDAEEAKRWLGHARAAIARVDASPELEVVQLTAEASIDFARGDLVRAEASLRRALVVCETAGCGRQHPSVALALATTLSTRGNAEEARRMWLEVQRLAELDGGPQSSDARTARLRLTTELVGIGEVARAAEELEAMLVELEADATPDTQTLARAWMAYADVEFRLGRDGLGSSLRALEWARLTYAEAEFFLAPYLIEAGQLFESAGNPRAALALFAEAEPYTRDRPRIAALLDIAQAGALVGVKESQSALVAADRALAMMANDPSTQPTNLAAGLHNRGFALADLGRWSEATDALVAAIEIYAREPSVGPAGKSHTDAQLGLAECYANAGRIAEARDTYRSIVGQPDAIADHRAKAAEKLAALDAGSQAQRSREEPDRPRDR
jgi:serine/threonine protein kinase